MKTIIRTIFEELSIGTNKLGKAFIESGVAKTLFAIWCIGWGIIGMFITIIYVLRQLI